MTAQAPVHIITDSSCDLDADVTAELGITVVPLEIRFGSETFADGVELSTAEFWQRCRRSDELPSTAAPSPGAFAEAYQRAAEAGANEVVVVTLSGDLSATIEAAQLAAAQPPNGLTCHVVDSRTVSAGLGLTVITAAELAAGGADGTQIVEAVRATAERVRVHAALDTLENLRKGGRIGAAQSLLGSVLSIKPLITVTDGRVEPAGRQRTRVRALRHLIDLVAAAGPNIAQIAVMHADCDDVDDFVQRIAPLTSSEPRVMLIGPVVGAHAGVGTIGVVFVERDPPAPTRA
ncbi:DegV family protein [Candidatus Poriferisodalis sp.]|uniref:DegV family protein n=1 Tax=Candidatus Poriferisodalis sp. TaxID=3101277 RepID=UPI003B02C819